MLIIGGLPSWITRPPFDRNRTVGALNVSETKNQFRNLFILNTVLNMGLSGVTYDQKVNIAVAHFQKKIKDSERPYDYKDYDSDNKWRLFKAWTILKDTDNVAAHCCSSSQQGFR